MHVREVDDLVYENGKHMFRMTVTILFTKIFLNKCLQDDQQGNTYV